MTFKQVTDRNRGEYTVFVCDCTSLEHIMRVWDWQDGDLLGIEIALNPRRGFFRRLLVAVKYLFGKYTWQFADIMLTPEDAGLLRHALDIHLSALDKEEENGTL